MISIDKGHFIASAEERRMVENLMRQAVAAGSRQEMEMLGQELVKPIQTIADYLEWAKGALMPLGLRLGEDPKIPIERYDVQAFMTAPDSQVAVTRVGYEYARFSFDAIDAGFEILWDELATAPFDILEQKTRRVAEEFARKRDTLCKTVLDAAAASVTNHTPTVSTAITKDSIDSVLKSAAAIGLPIKTVVVNSGTVLAMRSWDSSTFRIYPPLQERLLRDGYLGEYGNCQWFSVFTVPTDYVYFLADPSQIGYAISVNDMEKATDIDIFKRTNQYRYHQKVGYYVGNPYAVWRLQIT